MYKKDMTVKGGSTPSCAACKYQRKKCSSGCILAPYFPASQHKVFQNVHNLYGVSKIMNLLKDLPTDELREDAMLSVKYESNMRAKFPVNGCTFIISTLEKQYLQAAQELMYVREQLKYYKDQFLNYPFGATHNNNCIDRQLSGSNTGEQMDFIMMMNSNHPNNSPFYEFGNVNINSNNTNNNNVELGFHTNNMPTYCDLENNDNHHTLVPIIQAPLVDLDHQEREASQECEDVCSSINWLMIDNLPSRPRKYVSQARDQLGDGEANHECHNKVLSQMCSNMFFSLANNI